MKSNKIIIIALYATIFLAAVTAAFAFLAVWKQSYSGSLFVFALLTLAGLMFILNHIALTQTREETLGQREKQLADESKNLKVNQTFFEQEKQSFDKDRIALTEENKSLSKKVEKLMESEQNRQYELESLFVLREIFKATSVHQDEDFDHILFEIILRINDYMLATESVLFLVDNELGAAVPTAYLHRLTSNSNFYAYFAQPVTDDAPEFSVRRSDRKGETLRGTLLHSDKVAGAVRLEITGQPRLPRAKMEEVFLAEVKSILLDRSMVYDAIENNQVLRSSTELKQTSSVVTNIVVPLVSAEQKVIGAFKFYIPLSGIGETLQFQEEKLRDLFSREIGALIKKEELREKSIRDGLTRLFNKTYFHSTLEERCGEAASLKEPLSLIMFDIDHFKLVNDTFGHLTGDIVLSKVSAVLREGTRSENEDIVCRYGGEEIAVILQGTDLDGARRLAERLRKAVENEPFTSSDGRDVPVTISAGVSQLTREMKNCNDLVAAADRSLYRAKQSGRNRVCYDGEK